MVARSLANIVPVMVFTVVVMAIALTFYRRTLD